jgi:hypothetical protein
MLNDVNAGVFKKLFKKPPSLFPDKPEKATVVEVAYSRQCVSNLSRLYTGTYRFFFSNWSGYR